MTIQQIHYVLVIAERGSLNKAAEVLYVSQPSLTTAVQELEKELGVTLFHRSGRGVALTNDGMEFVTRARTVYREFTELSAVYGKGGRIKPKFGVSTQHYSFAVKSFVEMVKQFDTAEYDFAIRETRTLDVIEDVHTGRSEVGVLYRSGFNGKALDKLLRAHALEFHPLVTCDAYVYLWRGHPLAARPGITLADLEPYPCLSFEQGGSGSFYFAEEILSTADYPRTIGATDRATMLNLMIGLNGYTLCSGIICEELNGAEYLAVPFCTPEGESADKMEIGYILRHGMTVSEQAKLYIEEMKRYLKIE